eukprot:s287_g9.t1
MSSGPGPLSRRGARDMKFGSVAHSGAGRGDTRMKEKKKKKKKKKKKEWHLCVNLCQPKVFIPVYYLHITRPIAGRGDSPHLLSGTGTGLATLSSMGNFDV